MAVRIRANLAASGADAPAAYCGALGGRKRDDLGRPWWRRSGPTSPIMGCASDQRGCLFQGKIVEP
jgi:hypothetical protein